MGDQEESMMSLQKNTEASLMIVAHFHSVIYTWETSFRLVVSSPDLFQPRDGGPGGVNDVTSKKNIEASLMIVAYSHSVIYTWEISFRLMVRGPGLFELVVG